MAKNDLPLNEPSTYTKQEIYALIEGCFKGEHCILYEKFQGCARCPFLHEDQWHCNLYMMRTMGRKEGHI